SVTDFGVKGIRFPKNPPTGILRPQVASRALDRRDIVPKDQPTGLLRPFRPLGMGGAEDPGFHPGLGSLGLSGRHPDAPPRPRSAARRVGGAQPRVKPWELGTTHPLRPEGPRDPRSLAGRSALHP